MLKQVLALASIVFVLICIGAMVANFIDTSAIWAYVENVYHLFDHEGILNVDSTPTGAAVYLNNKFVGQTPLSKKISGGPYDVKLLLDGYETFARHIIIEKRQTSLVQAKLAKEYGILQINSTPTNATVFLDGKRQGQGTPLELKVPLGKYSIKVVKDQFYSFEDDVVVKAGSPTVVQGDLVRQVGRLILETTPSGAKAYIGEDLIGTTPLTHDKPVGKYVLTLKKPGFRDKVIEANLAPDESLDITVELSERSGSLNITTNPPGAEVHVNDAYQGETPISVQKKPGVYKVSIRKKQYRELNEEIVIEDNITKNIQRDLDPAIGQVRIDSTPSNAKVWVDGEDVGYTPIVLNKLEGNYKIRIAKPGYQNFEDEMSVGEGAFVQIKPELERER
jgi:hypothetical protein